jgi:hypothetical protein
MSSEIQRNEALYKNVLSQYEQMHATGKISDAELAILKSSRTIQDVIAEVKDSAIASEEKQGVVEKFFRTIGRSGLQKVERVAQVVGTAVDAGMAIYI